MNKRKPIWLLLSIIVILASSQIYGAYFKLGDGLPNPQDIYGNTLANIPAVEVAINSFQDRLKQDPQDAVTYALLANQYTRQARETGDVSAYQRAEAALNKSLALLPNYPAANTSLA